jgi:hypothetical protein
MAVGVDRVVRMARKIGLKGRIPSVPSVLLGAAEVTPLDLTSAFSTFATLGTNAQPRLVTSVENRDRVVIWSAEPVVKRALAPAIAYIVHQHAEGRGRPRHGVRGARRGIQRRRRRQDRHHRRCGRRLVRGLYAADGRHDLDGLRRASNGSAWRHWRRAGGSGLGSRHAPRRRRVERLVDAGGRSGAPGR